MLTDNQVKLIILIWAMLCLSSLTFVVWVIIKLMAHFGLI